MKRLVLRYRRATDDEDVIREDVTPRGFVFALGKVKYPVRIAASELVDCELIEDEVELPTGEEGPPPETLGVPFPLAPVSVPIDEGDGLPKSMLFPVPRWGALPLDEAPSNTEHARYFGRPPNPQRAAHLLPLDEEPPDAA